MDIKITDLVDAQALQQLQQLNTELQNVRTQYMESVRMLAQGLKINIEVSGDMKKIQDVIVQGMSQAQKATDDYNKVAEKRNEIIQRTTNEMSKELSALHEANRAENEKLRQDKEGIKTAESIIGTHKENVRQLINLNQQLKDNKEKQKQLTREGKAHTNQMVQLVAQERNLKASKQQLTQVMRIEEKMNMETKGSFDQLSHTLELMKRAYKEMSAVERQGAKGQYLREHIVQLDNAMKDASADLGEFQRNVGNYATGVQNSLLSALGVNTQYAQSIIQLGNATQGGMAMAGTALKTFGNSLYALCTNPYFLAIAGVAGAVGVFKWWWDYNNGIAEATRLTMQFYNVTSTQAKEIRDGIQAVADVYDIEFKEALTSVDALTSHFGITAKEALRIISDGFSKGADAQGNFLSNIQQYAVAFKDAGVSADQFIAILAQTPNGIITDKLPQLVQMATKRLREFNDSTASAINAIGLDADDMFKKLQDGSMTFFDAIQQISARLGELPEQSQVVGEVLKDVFGKQGSSAGMQLVEALAGVETQIDGVNTAIGELSDMQKEEARQQELYLNALSKHLDKTGGGFDKLKHYGKIAWTQVKWACVEYINMMVDAVVWVDTNAKKLAVMITTSFSQIYSALGTSVSAVGQGISKVFSDIVKGLKNLVSFNLDDAGDSFMQLATDAKNSANIIQQAFKTAFANISSEYNRQYRTNRFVVEGSVNGTKDTGSTGGSSAGIVTGGDDDSEKKDKKTSGRSSRSSRSSGRSSTAKKTTDTKQTDKKEKTPEQLAKEAEAMEREVRTFWIDTIADIYADSQVQMTKGLDDALKLEAEKYTSGAITYEEYQKNTAKLQEKYQMDSLQKTADYYGALLGIGNLTEEQREDYERKLAEATNKIQEQTTANAVKAYKEREDAHKASTDKMIADIEKYAKSFTDLFSALGDLMKAQNDAKIEQLEQQQELEDEKYDKDVERIQELEDIGAISKEEAEARKRDAEARTAEKNKQFEEQRRKLEYENAVWEKATSASQCAINTALGIMNVWATAGNPYLAIALTALVGATGAMQLATILAQPIKAFKEGTHGKLTEDTLAFVGDGGKAEMISYAGKLIETPAKPTLVNLPKGAEVFPDAKEFMRFRLPQTNAGNNTDVIVNNDYRMLEKKQNRTNQLLGIVARNTMRSDYKRHKQNIW